MKALILACCAMPLASCAVTPTPPDTSGVVKKFNVLGRPDHWSGRQGRTTPGSRLAPEAQWTRVPQRSDVANIFRRHVRGEVQARLRCGIGPSGALRQCVVLDIRPDDPHFRKAVTRLAQLHSLQSGMMDNLGRPLNSVNMAMRLDDGRPSAYPDQSCILYFCPTYTPRPPMPEGV